MKLAGFTYLLGRSLAMLGSLASRAQGPSQLEIVNRVHAKWHSTGVTLTATDGRRSLSITLTAERIPYATTPGEDEAVFRLMNAGFGEGQLFHTIFRSPDGDVKLIGEHMEPVGISRTRTEPAAIGINLGHDQLKYPIEAINDIRAQLDTMTTGVHLLEINPAFLAEGLTMISGLWQLIQHPGHPERIDMQIPDHPHAPMRLTSQFPEKLPLFQIEYILMPYRTP